MSLTRPFAPRPIPPLQSGSLKGLPSISMPVCIFHISHIFEDPLSHQNEEFFHSRRIAERRIQKIIRRMLHKAGVSIQYAVEGTEPYERPFFRADTSIHLLPQSKTVSSVKLSLIQEVALVRDPSIKIEATTWSYGPVIMYSSINNGPGEKNTIEEIIEDIIQRQIREGIQNFISSYNRDNREEGKEKIESEEAYDTKSLDEG